LPDTQPLIRATKRPPSGGLFKLQSSTKLAAEAALKQLFDVQGFAAGRGKFVCGIGQATLDREWKKPAAYILHF
jgi:hypothetical protein